MAATVTITCWTGSPLAESGPLAGGADLSSADNCAYDAANRIAHPLTANSYSFEKWLRAKVTVMPDNWIAQFKIWGDGALPANAVLRVGSVGGALVPVNTPSVIAVNDFSPMVVGAKGVWDLTTRTVANLGASPYTNFLVFQLYIQSGFPPGDWGPEVVYYEYQEA